MKKVFIFSFLIAAATFQLGCGGAAENSNAENTNSAPVSATNTNAQAQETPLPTFTDAETALAEGKKLLDENKTELSIEALNQAVKLNPELADAYFTLGIAYSVLEKERANTQTVEEEPSSTKTPVPKKGKKDEFIPLTASDKAFDKAAKLYEKITKKEPKNDAAFYNLGRSYNKLNKDEEAREALSEAVKLKPDDIEYQIELGAILIKLSEYDEAVKILKKAVSLDENNLYAQELLEKAEAGQKRINFGIKPKTPEPVAKPKTEKPSQRPTPPLKIEDQPILKPTPSQ
jgi:tetratricopeptide (TPR) repeat protein